jgi:ribosomal protein S18 acetylase RimI-like enzyme
MPPFSIRPLTPADVNWVSRFILNHWGADFVVAHGVSYQPHTLPGFAAFEGDEPVGLLTYHIENGDCEVVTIDSVRSGQGIGSALIDAVQGAARRAGCKRLWLITTNDNLNALSFYQKRGFELVAVHRGAVNKSRELKPQISLIGEHGIPLRDEIELEMKLR